jgi:ADP-heptose:LPS heptosyltransferase
MGYGDWIIATGQAREIYAQRKLPVLVIGAGMRPQWSEVFENNPKIVRRPQSTCVRLLNGSGMRPYIAGKTDAKWTWRRFKPPRGELFFTNEEQVFGQANGLGAVMIEPTVKTNRHDNKAWVPSRWQDLVDAMPGVEFVQCGPNPAQALRGVRYVVTTRFREACAVLASARAFVGTEGGLMHAAAAVDVPAVILWSEFIDPGVTGYASHRNIRHAGESCGSRLPCPSCRASMEAITVEEVKSQLEEVLA